MKHVILIVSGIGIVALCLWGCNSFIPFSLADTKVFEAHHLRDNVKDWEMRLKPESYGYTNNLHASYIYRTNIIFGSNVYTSIMRLDSSNFRNRGYLLATENQEVFWVGADGRVEELKSRPDSRR